MAAAHKIVPFTFSASYPGGGEAFEPGAGLLGDPNSVVLPIAKAGYVFDFDYAAKKIRAFRQSAATSALTEPTGVNLASALGGPIDVLVLSRT
jgi:hypothetical protein